MARDDVDAGRKEGLTSTERGSWSSCDAATGCWRWRLEILKRAIAPTSPGRTSSQNSDPAGPELAADGLPVAVTCRVLEVPRRRYYEAIGRAPSRP